MAHKLYLFKNITPNITGHPFYNIKTFTGYLNALKSNSNYFIKEITADNYRINALVCKITKVNFNENIITYIIEYDDVTQFGRCYFVDKINAQSDMLLMNLSIDNWGTFYKASLIEHLHVTRCNRNIGIGIYDKINASKNYPTAEYLGGEYITGHESEGKIFIPINQLVLVFRLAWNVQENLSGSRYVSRSTLYAIPLSTLRTKYVQEYNEGREEPIDIPIGIYEIITDFIGGLKGIAGNLGNLQAEFESAYILPASVCATYGPRSTPILKIKSLYLDKEFEVSRINNIFAQRRKIEFEITNFDINKDYYAGTAFDKALILPRFTKNFNIYYVFEVREDKVNIFCQAGQEQFDIEEMFTIPITQTTHYEPVLRSIVQALNSTAGTAKGVAKGVATGNVIGTAGAVLGGVTSGIGFADIEKSIKGNGTAGITYRASNSEINPFKGHMVTPFAITKYESINNEKLNARYNGASFNEFIDDINDVFDFNLLGEGDYVLTHLVADDIKINGLPSIARETIETAFRTGVELYDYETTGN